MSSKKPGHSETLSPSQEIKSPPPVSVDDFDLSDLLESGEQILEAEAKQAQLAAMTKAEVDAMIRRQHEAITEMMEAEKMLETQLKKIEEENPFMNGSVEEEDIDRLQSEGIVNTKLAGDLKKVFKMLNDLAKVENPTSAALAHHQKVVLTLEAIRKQIEGVIEVKQAEIRERREKLKEAILSDLSEKNKRMEAVIAEVMANPRVVERLQELTDALEAEQAEAEKKQTEDTLKEAGMTLQSLTARHKSSIERLKSVLKKPDIMHELAVELLKNDPTHEKTFESTRRALKEAILEKENDEQIKSPREVVPWENSTSIDYREGIDFLKSKSVVDTLRHLADDGNEKAKKLLELRSTLLVENDVLRKLFGPKWSVNDKTKERFPGPFWDLFEQRKQLPAIRAAQEARTKAERAAQEAREKREAEAKEKKRADFMESAKEILGRGGFVVDAPVYQKDRFGIRLVGKELGVVRLEEAVGAKSYKVWKVAEVLGNTGDLKAGMVFDLALTSSPHWLREAAKDAYVMDGPKFVKRKDQVE